MDHSFCSFFLSGFKAAALETKGRIMTFIPLSQIIPSQLLFHGDYFTIQ